MTENNLLFQAFYPCAPSFHIFLYFIYSSTSFCFAVCKITLQSWGGRKTKGQQPLGSLVDGATVLTCFPLGWLGPPSLLHALPLSAQRCLLNEQTHFLQSLVCADSSTQEPCAVLQLSCGFGSIWGGGPMPGEVER